MHGKWLKIDCVEYLVVFIDIFSRSVEWAFSHMTMTGRVPWDLTFETMLTLHLDLQICMGSWRGVATWKIYFVFVEKVVWFA